MPGSIQFGLRISLAAGLTAVLLWCSGDVVAQNHDPAPRKSFLERPKSGKPQIRIASWNVKSNSIFRPTGGRRESFGRILKAIQPDILCLQEIFPFVPTPELIERIEEDLPLPAGGRWHVHRAGDNAILSRFPLLKTAEDLPVLFPQPRMPDFRYGQAMALVDVPDAWSSWDFYVIAIHNKSRGNELSITMRQRQSDSVVRWIRGLKDPSQPNHLPAGTPLVILGDLNVLESEPRDASLHLTTLITGNIQDEETFGPDVEPDWDNSNLIEVKPRHNGREKDYYTWRVDSSPFPPGALDRVLYTDSMLSVLNSFVLNTTILTHAELAEAGLLATDVLLNAEPGNYDHLPIAVDFALPRGTAAPIEKP